MIQHIVLLRLKPGTTAEQKAALLHGLVALLVEPAACAPPRLSLLLWELTDSLYSIKQL